MKPTSGGLFPEDDPIAGHPTYESLSYLSRGAHGFVVLARTRTSDQQVGASSVRRHSTFIAVLTWGRRVLAS